RIRLDFGGEGAIHTEGAAYCPATASQQFYLQSDISRSVKLEHVGHYASAIIIRQLRGITAQCHPVIAVVNLSRGPAQITTQFLQVIALDFHQHDGSR